MTPKQVAVNLAKKVSSIIRKNFGHVQSTPKLELPRKFTINIRISVEQIMVRQIQRLFPGHGIFSEEYWASKETAQYVWLVDPLDGVLNSLRNIPCFSTTIALVKDGQTILSVIANPMTKELLVAEKGKGTIMNNRRAHVSGTRGLEQAVACFGWYSFNDKLPKRPDWLRVFNQTAPYIRKIRVLGSNIWTLGRIADGSLDIFYAEDRGVNIAAASLIVQEAGGVVTNDHGETVHPFSTKVQRVVAANKPLHQKFLRLLQ